MVKHTDNEKKLYGLINSHHGKRFLFMILWVFANSGNDLSLLYVFFSFDGGEFVVTCV